MDPAKLHRADQLLIDSSELIFVFLFSSFLPALRPTGTTAIKRLPHDSYSHHACGHIITTCMLNTKLCLELWARYAIHSINASFTIKKFYSRQNLVFTSIPD